MQSYGNIFNASIWKCAMENCRLGHRLLGDTGPAGVGYCKRSDEFEFTISNPTLIWFPLNSFFWLTERHAKIVG